MKINLTTPNGSMIHDGDLSFEIDGVTYSDIMIDTLTSDSDEQAAAIQIIFNRYYVAEVSDEDTAAVLSCYHVNTVFDESETAAVKSVCTLDENAIRKACRGYQALIASRKRITISDGMNHADIAGAIRAAKAAREAKTASRAIKTAAKAERARAGGAVTEKLSGSVRWFSAVADVDLQRVIVRFSCRPSAAILSDLKAHGFSWNAVAAEWRRGYNQRSISETRDMIARWLAFKKDAAFIQ